MTKIEWSEQTTQRTLTTVVITARERRLGKLISQKEIEKLQIEHSYDDD